MASKPSLELKQIININMQRKKSDMVDYSLASSTQNCNNIFNQNIDRGPHLHSNHQTFMKYASSIIQVVNEDKLQKSNQSGAQGQQRSPIYEISQVNYYQTEALGKNSLDKPVLSNNYNTLGEGFKKKKNKKQILTYNFTNITLFINQVSKFQRNILKTAFIRFKNVRKKPKPLNNQPPKSKSSFHSDYTASTNNQEVPKKINNLYLQLKKNQEFKQGINILKGWIQFRLLIIKSQAFRFIHSFFKFKESERKSSKIKASSQLDIYFAKDEGFSILNQEDQSLVYTADQNFQFSQKQFTVSGPQKTSLQQKLNFFNVNKDSKIADSICGIPQNHNNHQSVVEVYRLSEIRQPSKLSQKGKSMISQAEPLTLKIPKERKHLILRTNTFQLPLISQFYLKDQKIPKQNLIPVRKDCFLRNENQVAEWNDQIIKQFQVYGGPLQKKKSFKQYQRKSKIFQDKSSKFITQSISSKNLQLNTERSTQKFQINQQTLGNTNQEKKGTHKVEDYYFQGLDSKVDRLIQSKSTIKNTNDRKAINQVQKTSIPCTLQRQSNALSKNIRIQESIVRDFPLQNPTQVSKFAQNPKNKIAQSKKKTVGFNIICGQQKPQNKPRIQNHVVFNSPQQRINTSPQNIHFNIVGINQTKRKPYFSPPTTLKQYDNYQALKNHLPFKPNVQPEHNQMRILDKPIIHPNKQREIPFIQNNAYQLKYPTHQPTIIANNAQNYFHKIDNHIQNVWTARQIISPPSYKVIPQIVPNRPVSRLTPSPPHVPLNFPIKTEYSPYGLTLAWQNSQKKVSLHSLQTHRNSGPQIRFQQQPKNQQKILSTKKQQICNQQYFVMQKYTNKPEENGFYFNNKYYNPGTNIPLRPNQLMMTPIVIPTNQFLDNKPRVILENQRPHSSFKQAAQRFNISVNSPMESQMQYIQRSNNLTSRNSSQISRPKSMNQRILVTMRRQH